MKVIDLLNKIANGEEVPKKIKYRKCIFEYEEKFKDYFTKNGIITTTYDSNGIFRNIFALYNTSLNDEIEIIEEDKKIEKLEYIENGEFVEVPSNVILMNKINEIIDYLEENK